MNKENFFLQNFHFITTTTNCRIYCVFFCRLINPCSDRICATPYSYRHVISLTNDEDLFAVSYVVPYVHATKSV